MGQSFACAIGLHPSTLAHLSRINSNFKKQVPKRPLNILEDYSLYMNVTICFLYVLEREGTRGEEFCLPNRLASVDFSSFLSFE
jgi:hypothetical protein